LTAGLPLLVLWIQLSPPLPLGPLSLAPIKAADQVHLEKWPLKRRDREREREGEREREMPQISNVGLG